MALLTIEEVTNLYLYGTKTKPLDLTSDAIIRSPGQNRREVVNVNDFMAGPGRFATAASFTSVRMFFTPGQSNIPPGAYTEPQMRQMLGLGNGAGDAYITQVGWGYSDSTDDYASRVYIWNSVAYEITDTTLFVVEADGTRYLENFAIIPLDMRDENFDFISSDAVTTLGNLRLERTIDPSGLGQQVRLGFQGPPTTRTYTEQDYANDVGHLPAFNPLLLPTALNEMTQVSDDLFASATRFLGPGDRPILYGTIGDDSLQGTRSRTGVDLADHRQLGTYVQNGNGIVYVAGAGDDAVTGTSHDDILIGGRGRDTLSGGAGDDAYRYAAGDGQDTIIDSDDEGIIEIAGVMLRGSGATLTTHHGRRAWQVQIGGQNVLMVEQSGSIVTGASLVVEGPALGTGGRIEIRNFVNGQFGIELDATNRVQFSQTTDFLIEGFALSIPLQLAGPAEQGQRLHWSINPSLHDCTSLVFPRQSGSPG